MVPNAPENNPAVFFPQPFWKWPNNCQEEECKAFPGAVGDVRAPRRPLLFRQLGYSRAHSTQNSQQLEVTNPPSSNCTTIQRRETLSLTSGSALWNCSAWGTLRFSTLKCLHVVFLYICDIYQHIPSSLLYSRFSCGCAIAELVLYCLTSCESLSSEFSQFIMVCQETTCKKLTQKSKTIWLA